MMHKKKPISLRGRILKVENANKLLEDGYYGLDSHCHSSFSYDVPDVHETSPEYMISEQQRLGLRQLLSDHDTLNGYNYLKKKGLSGSTKTTNGVIPAAEISIMPRKSKHVDIIGAMHSVHINVFGLDKNDLFNLESIAQKKRDMDEFIGYLKQRDLYWSYNHPFWHEPGEKLNWRVIPGFAKYYFDVIELNSNRPRMLNDLALHLAEKFGKGIVASTDSHIGEPGRAFVLADGKNFEQFWHNVKQGRMYVVRKDMTTWGVVKESSAMTSHIFSANVNAAKERRFTPVTGIKPLDKVAKAVTSGRLKRSYFTKKVIHTLMYTLNYTAGPILAWRLYMSKQNTMAEDIQAGVKNITKNLNHKTLHKVS